MFKVALLLLQRPFRYSPRRTASLRFAVAQPLLVFARVFRDRPHARAEFLYHDRTRFVYASQQSKVETVEGAESRNHRWVGKRSLPKFGSAFCRDQRVRF